MPRGVRRENRVHASLERPAMACPTWRYSPDRGHIRPRIAPATAASRAAGAARGTASLASTARTSPPPRRRQQDPTTRDAGRRSNEGSGTAAPLMPMM